MIEGPDFIWMHFPKCAGSATEAALRQLFSGKLGYRFDRPHPLWHENIAQREERDPGFTVGGRRIICNFRRLPSWIISRVRYGQSLARSLPTVPRDMILSGKFFEDDGTLNTAERYVAHYSPGVGMWIRAESLVDDFEAAFGVRTAIGRVNETPAEIADVRFDLSVDDVSHLYHACPTWAALERRLYGHLLHEPESH